MKKNRTFKLETSSLSDAELLHQKSLKKASENMEELLHGSNRRQSEKEFLNYISLGNVTLAREFISSMTQGSEMILDVGTLSENALLQARFAIVASITLFCRTAIDCGLPEYLAYSISDVYINYLSNARDEKKIYDLFVQAFLEYCQAVQDWHLSSCSPSLKACCEYIFSHLTSRITMKDLGNACGLSPNYVSDLFARELGTRPGNYIRSEKLKYAAHLLSHSTTSVSLIAEFLAFPSASAFSSQFRDKYGVTPHQYRKTSSHPTESDEFSAQKNPVG